MQKTTVAGVLGMALLAIVMCVAAVGPAMAEATFENVAKIPHDFFTDPGGFLNRVFTTPAGNPAAYHDLTGSKPVTQMLWGAPRPTLCQDRMR